MQSWYESEPFQRLRAAVRANDYAAISQVMEEQVAMTEGADKAFWLMVRMGKWTRYPATRMISRAWDDLEEALRVAPDHPGTQSSALYIALGLTVETERTERLAGVIRLLQPNVRWLQTDPRFWLNLGLLHYRRGQHKPAIGSFARTADGYHRQTPEFQASFGCHLVTAHALGALCSVRYGDLEGARLGIARMEQLYAELAPSAREPVVVSLPKAELALYEGRLHDARSLMQAAVLEKGWDPGQLSASPLLIEVDLLAARTALAESNEAGFRSFCDKALARALHHDRPITAARIRRMMADHLQPSGPLRR